MGRRRKGSWIPGGEPGDPERCAALYGAQVRLTEAVLGHMPRLSSTATAQLAGDHAEDQRRLGADLEQLRARRRHWQDRASMA